MRGFWTAAALAAMVCPAVLGQMSYVSQLRAITATGPGGGPTNSRSASDFGEFIASVASNGPQGGVAGASMTSSLTSTRVLVTGDASPGQNAAGQFGNASSDLDVTFDVTTPASFQLIVTYEFASISLTGPGVNLNFAGIGGGGSPSGTFQVGRYRITGHTSGVIQAGRAGRGDYQVVLNTNPLPTPLSTAFTYQGRLERDGAPLEGTADLQFKLCIGAEGSAGVGPMLGLLGAEVHAGLVTAQLDFGQVFNGERRFLEVSVRSPAGSGAYTPLLPRREVTLTPHAAYAITAATAENALTAGRVPWSGVTGVPANVSGAFSPFAADTNGITFTGGSLGLGGASLALDTAGVWGGLTVDAGALSVGGAPLNNAEFYGLRFGAATSGEGISSNRAAGGTQFGLDFFTGRQLRMSILASGRVGIGTSAPDQPLTVNGNASKPGGGSWAAFCDPRLKEDVRPMEGTLDRLLGLRGYRFRYTAAAVASGRALPGEQLGLMADEVERVFPDWVSRSDDGYRMVTERATTALLVEALRDLRAEKDRQVRALKDELAARERTLGELTSRLEALERR